MFGRIASITAACIEAAGILVIVIGALASSIYFLRRLAKTHSFEGTYPAYRSDLGRCILLGLELLVAADIVGTVVVDPTFVNLGVLAIIVAIRIALSFAMDVEINGHWPWRQTELTVKRNQDARPQRLRNTAGRGDAGGSS
ncbi:MAG: DUF1622 domain-containing protein [Gammaproteobacteria bacterium]|nr:DUF1622 domain-containing protein [Gammaproteobacteria bacterium]